MRDIRSEIEGMLQYMVNAQENCNNELCRCREGHLYRTISGGIERFIHATEVNGTYVNAKRKSIAFDGEEIRQLARKKLLETQSRYLGCDIAALKSALERLHVYNVEEMKKSMPRAYRNLPGEYFVEYMENDRMARVPKSEIYVPEALIRAAEAGVLTDRQKQEIREIQREWANQPYEQNTKNLKNRNIVTSRGLKVRSKSEAMLIERMYHFEIPFRYDQIIRVGSRIVSPDLTFFSITDGEHYWEHGGLISKQDYADYHMYKRRIYESAGIVSWKNYIETFDEEDGSINLQMVDAEIQYKLLKRLQLA